MTAATWLAVIFLPLGAAVLLVVPRWRGAVMRCAPATALPGLALALWTEPGATVDLPWLIIGLRFGIDVTARTLLLLTSSLYLLVGIDALVGARRKRLDHRFTAFYLAAMSGNLGLIIAQDAASFYALFALMSFAAAGLVAYPRTPASNRATRIYLILVMLSEVLIFAGLVTACTGGSHTLDALPAQVLASPHAHLIMALLIAGFGIKAGLVPLHVWLPVSYQAAPLPAAALLSACMSKAGLLGWMRCLPIIDAGMPGWGQFLIVAGFVTAFYAMAVGLCQQDPKVVLAYSSMSKMGIMAALIGMSLSAPSARDLVMAAVLLYALHHAAAKTALFLGLGAARARPRLWPALIIPSTALAGLPWTTGWAAKYALKQAAHDALPAFDAHIVSAMYAVAILTTLLMIRFLLLARQDAQPIQVRWPQLVPTTVALITVLVLPFLWSAPASGKHPSLLSSVWPVAVGGVLAFALSRRLPTIPSGDVLVLFERLAGAVPRLVPFALRRLIQREYSAGARIAEWLATHSPRSGIAQRLTQSEDRLRQWPAVGTSVLLLTALAFLLALLNR